jgi:hypothetical protein
VPDPPGPADPGAAAPDDQPVRAGWREIGRPSRRKVLTLLLTAGAMVVLLCFASGWFAEAKPGRETATGQAGPAPDEPGKATPAQPAEVAANRARPGKADAAQAGAGQAGTAEAGSGEGDAAQVGAGKADAARAAADRARAEKLAAAQAADARAAGERADRAAAQDRVIAMPALVGRKLNVAMDLATDAGLAGVTVCRTPDGDSPLWWSNWRVTAQDVPAGARIDAGQEVCLAAVKG